MAMQLFAANRNSVCHHDGNINNHFLSLSPPSLGLNRVRETSFVSTEVITTNPQIALHQNDNISLQSHDSPIFGQLGFNHRVTEMKTTIYSQNRIRVHKVIDYAPLAIPPSLCLSDINGVAINRTEIIRTQFLTAVSNRERISTTPNNSVRFQNQPISGNINQTIFNQVLDPFSRSEHSGELFYQTPSSNQPILIQNNPHDFEFKGNGVTAYPPISVRFPDTDDQDTSHGQLALTLSNLSNQEQAHTPVNQGVHDHNPQVDGQTQEETYGTRSLPYKKYGPYTCPRCKNKFKTSQSFASHMGLHYKDENIFERKKRRALKYKKKNLHLVKSSDGLTVVPESFAMKTNANGHMKKERGKVKVGVKTNGKRVVKQEGSFVGVVVKKGVPYEGVVIKKEPM